MAGIISSRSHRSRGNARGCFEEAIRLDDGYAAPHAEIGFGHFITAMNGMVPLREVAGVVRVEVERALELEPADPLPRFLLASVALSHDYDWPAAEQHFRVLMSAPHVSAYAHWSYATLYLAALGRFTESADEMKKAVDVDPLNGTWRGVWGGAPHLRWRARPGN